MYVTVPFGGQDSNKLQSIQCVYFVIRSVCVFDFVYFNTDNVILSLVCCFSNVLVLNIRSRYSLVLGKGLKKLQSLHCVYCACVFNTNTVILSLSSVVFSTVLVLNTVY